VAGEIYKNLEPASSGNIRIAYIILAHHRPESLVRLIRRLYAPDHGFFIHYNLRSPEAEFQHLAKELGSLQNIKLLVRQKCLWGDSGIVRATLNGIQELAQGGFIYDYAVLLTGQDYPIKSDAKIRNRLASAAGGSFMEATAWPIPNWEKGRAIKRIENFHWHLPFPRWTRSLGWPPARQHLAIPMKRKIPGGLHPYFGSSFWYLHRSCLKFIHDYAGQHPEFLEFFHHALIPDESFFQTLLMNSPLAPSVTTRTLTFIEWRPPWPGILTIEDLPKLQQSDCLLARKFDHAVDEEILKQLDVLNKAI
jgi:Core-2/I-Branching enzyme